MKALSKTLKAGAIVALFYLSVEYTVRTLSPSGYLQKLFTLGVGLLIGLLVVSLVYSKVNVIKVEKSESE